jgi:hypothetical protein
VDEGGMTEVDKDEMIEVDKDEMNAIRIRERRSFYSFEFLIEEWAVLGCMRS